MDQQPLAPTVFVIFGVTGDLANKKLLPSLFNLYLKNRLPQQNYIFGFARRPWNDSDFQNQAAVAIKNASPDADPEKLKSFTAQLRYIASEFDNIQGYKTLQAALEKLDADARSCSNRIFYLATPPSNYQTIVKHLGEVNLAKSCSHNVAPVRLIIEKPFGTNLETARQLNQTLLRYFTEQQIYRIDHYLGKESVQNILAFRFANTLFEPIWNNQYIDHIQITAAEDIGIENRGAYYDETGALRDFVQNHLLQLLAAIAMDEPKSLQAQDIRKAREDTLKDLLPLTDVAKQSVRGQYSDYKQEPKVNPSSQVETYIALKVLSKSKRFKNVPFYLRTGKKLAQKVSDITIQFKPANKLYQQSVEHALPNTITMRLQPNEGISIRLFTKQPGPGNNIAPSQIDFCYRNVYGGPGEDAYSRLIVDVIAGDQTLFTSSAEVEAQWKITTPILESWQKTNQPAYTYEPGSWGPKEADEFIKRDGRQWLAQQVIVCPI